MANVLSEFLVSIGFAVDTPAQSRAEAAQRATETRLTQATREALAQRRHAEDVAMRARIEAAVAAGRQLTAEERAGAERLTRVEREAEERRQTRERESHRKDRERRSQADKEVRTAALQLSAFVQKITLGIEGYLTARSAVGLVRTLDQAAKGFEALGYAAQRAGAAPKTLSAFAYAVSQLGGSAAEATASLDAFGEQFRNYPVAMSQALERMGVRTKDLNGHLRDNGEIAADLAEHYQKMVREDPKNGYARARFDAQYKGFSEHAFQAMLRPELREKMEEEKSNQAAVGNDQDEAAKTGTAFAQASRGFGDILDAIKTKVEQALLRSLLPRLDDLSTWIKDHGKAIADTTATITTGIVGLATAFLKNVDVQKAIDDLSSGLETFSKYLTSDDFKRDAKEFATDLGLLAKAIHEGLRLLGLVSTKDPVGTATTMAMNSAAEYAEALLHGGNADLGAAGFRRHTHDKDGHVQTKEDQDRDEASVREKIERLHRAGSVADDQGVVPTGAHTPLKDLIALKETGTTGAGGYTTVYGHAERGGSLAPPKPITEMTIAEVLAYQHEMKPRAGTRAFPVGRGQWVEQTLRGLVQGMDPNTKFTPEFQEKLFDKSIAGRINQGPGGFRDEWDSFHAVSDAQINEAVAGHRAAIAAAKNAVKESGPTAGGGPATPAPRDASAEAAKDAVRRSVRERYANGEITAAEGRKIVDEADARIAAGGKSQSVHLPARPFTPTPHPSHITTEQGAPEPGSDDDPKQAAQRGAILSQRKIHARMLHSDAEFRKAMGGRSPYGSINPDAFKVPPLGHVPSVSHIDNSKTSGDRSMTQHITIHGVKDAEGTAGAIRRMASRGQQDLLRNMQGAES